MIIWLELKLSTKVEQYCCPACEKAYYTLQRLRLHQFQKHKIQSRYIIIYYYY